MYGGILGLDLKHRTNPTVHRNYHRTPTGQPRIERSFELDILSKNFRMKQKKIYKDQRILPLTAIAI